MKRAALRWQGLRVSGTVLADTLLNYSGRGQACGNDLKALIGQNHLAYVDDTYLRHMAVIHIVPADFKPNQGATSLPPTRPALFTYHDWSEIKPVAGMRP